ncbi:MAG: glycoside hydrolase family 88 protein [Terriglobia bacterium]
MPDPLVTGNSLVDIAHRAAELLIPYSWKVWFWGDSIGLEGLLDASELTGNPQYAGFVHGLLKGWLAREKQRSEFDYTAPGVALLRVYEATRDSRLLDAAFRHAEYMAGFRKTSGGAFVRYEDAAIELPPELPADHPEFETCRARSENVKDGGPCVFVDSVHFDGPFFAKLYQVTGRDQFRELALRNILPQIDLLFDPPENLFHHFWLEKTKSRNGVLWGRGNGWGLLGLVRTLECLPADDPGARTIREVLERQAGRLAELQDAKGGWHTVLDDPSSYIEPSIAAFVVDGFSASVRSGWLDKTRFRPVIESGMQFLLAHVDSSGLLTGVSYETFPSTRAEHYRKMPRGAMVPWGQGPLLTALRSYSLLDARV